jgi:hypothetical protein
VSAGHLKLAEENLAAVKVPEPRLDFLEQLYKPKKRTEATVNFVDLPGSTEGDDGFQKHLPALRQSDALLFVLREFESPAVPMPPGGLDAAKELSRLRDELLVADFVICDSRIERLEAAVKKPTPDRDKNKHELEVLTRCRAALEKGTPLREVVQPGDEEKMLRSFGFLTQKPGVVTVNVGEDRISEPATFQDEFANATFNVCAEIEAEIMSLDEADRPEFMESYRITDLARDRVIRACFDALGMICFLTAGEPEVRAWPIPKGSPAVDAAGSIHSDLARGFIRAETIAFEDLLAAGSKRDAKAAGKVRLEPKNYIVQDGDVLDIRFNV